MFGRPDAQTAPNPGARISQRFLRRSALDRTPLAITHERIYILPSKRGWVFIFSLLIMLIASMNYAINLGFALCFLLTGMLASSLLATYRNLAGLTLEQISTTPVHAGAKLAFRLSFRNPHNRERPGIKVSTDSGHSDNINLPPEDRTIAALDIPTQQRGWQALGRITLSTDYPLGLWYSWSYLHTPCRGLVYPAPEADAPPLPGGHLGDSGDNERSRRRGDEEYAGLRKYQPGDPIAHIAWKAAARDQGWYSKEFEQEPTSLKRHFALDDTRELATLDARLSRLTAWVLRAEHDGTAYSLSLPTYRSPSSLGPTHRDTLLEQLALFGLADEH
ncbi:MAG: DUF58 domain-containing protein [Gammaproteobacteria bacterium]|nr:DUF58 domain-containing protein [Gammaproteobacteria bacterium]